MKGLTWIKRYTERQLWRGRYYIGGWRCFFLKAWEIFLEKVWDKRRKVTLTFYLPEDSYHLTCAQQGINIKHAIQDFDNWLKGYDKHCEEDEWPKLDEIRDRLYKELGAGDIDLWGC